MVQYCKIDTVIVLLYYFAIFAILLSLYPVLLFSNCDVLHRTCHSAHSFLDSCTSSSTSAMWQVVD